MHHLLQFEIAMRKLPLLAKAAGANPPSDSSQASASSVVPVTRAVMSPSSSTTALPGDRLHLGCWPGLDSTCAEDVDCSDSAALREAARSKAQQCLDHSLAPSTVSSYEAALRATIPEAEQALDKTSLPLQDENSLFELFGFLQVRDAESLHWTRVRTLRAAIIKWHAIRGVTCIFDSCAERMRAYWTGLSKGCTHSSVGRSPSRSNP